MDQARHLHRPQHGELSPSSRAEVEVLEGWKRDWGFPVGWSVVLCPNGLGVEMGLGFSLFCHILFVILALTEPPLPKTRPDREREGGARRERQRGDRQTDKEGRQRDRQADRQTDGQTHTQRNELFNT